MKRLILAITLVSLPLTALLTAQSADAQSRSRESRQRTTQKAEENQYPNTSRAEPDRKTNERSMRRIQTAYTALNEGEYDKSRPSLANWTAMPA
ncbi:hypothetical protein [Pseudofulvimonas gallinarii]|uniref:hypothetical protein n=1 Tax=Pseudofulvimonas gallinarii TaxID=634155 RepID=UPI000F472849|nr:hypothetical protein [Pseudofulvimonas gallinarii]